MPAQFSEAFAKVSEDGKIPVTLKKLPDFVNEDEFISEKDLAPVRRDAAERSLKRHLSELVELISQNKWEDVVALYYPVQEKQPDLVENDMDTKVRAKVAFALGHLNRFDDAIRDLSICTEKDPEDFHFNSSLAYTAYNSLFAAMNREIFLSGNARSDRIDLAHAAFRKAQELRPDGVTNYYRQGMLFKKLERKSEKAIPLFETAVSNWDRLSKEEKEARHQERVKRGKRGSSPGTEKFRKIPLSACKLPPGSGLYGKGARTHKSVHNRRQREQLLRSNL